MKKLLAFVLCAFMLFSAAACGGNGGGGGGKTKIVFACNAGYQLDFEKRVKEFNKIHPEIEVEVQGIAAASWGEMLQTIANDIALGVGPDIADIASEGMYAFAESGLHEPLDSYIERDAEELKETLDNVDENIVNAHKIGGKTYSLPTVWNNMVIFYNKNVLKAKGLEEPTAGWTTDEFLEMCKTVSAGNTGGNNDVYGYAYYNNYFTTLEPWMRAFDSSILTDDWSASNVESENSKKALKFLYDMVNTYKVSPSVGTSDIDLFVQDKLAFMGCGLWYVESLKVMGFDVEDYDVVPFPSDTGELRSVIGVGGTPIFKNSKNKEAAWTFAKFLAGKDFQEDYLSENIWAIPSVKTAADIMCTKPNVPANAEIFYESAAYGKYVPAPAQYTAVESAILREFGAYIADVKSLDEAAAAAAKSINEALGG